jgi:exosortase
MAFSTTNPKRSFIAIGSWTLSSDNLPNLLLAALFITFGWQTFVMLANVYQTSEDYSHGFVVPFVSFYAAYEIRKQYPEETYRSCWWGVPLAILGTGLVIFGVWYRTVFMFGTMSEAFIAGLGIFSLLIGLCFSAGGPQFLSRYLFPLGYLAFTVTWPERLTILVTAPLRTLVSNVSVVIIRSQGISVFQEGNMLHLANSTLGVADACSGIRSLWVMLAAAMAMGYFLRCGFSRTVILLILAVPLAVLFNIIRVVATGMLVVWFGPRFAQGTLHELTGTMVFFLGVLTLVGIAWLFAWSRMRRATGEMTETANGKKLSMTVESPKHGSQRVLIASLGLFLVIGTAAQLLIEHRYAESRSSHVKVVPVTARRSFNSFPSRVGDFIESGRGTLLQSQLDFIRPSDTMSKYFRSPKEMYINLWSLYWEPYQGSTDVSLGPHSPDACYPGAGWEIKTSGSSVITNLVPGRNIYSRIYVKDGKKMVLFYYVSGVVNSPLHTRLRHMVRTLLSPEAPIGSQYVVVIQSMVTSSVDQTTEEVIKFMRQLAPVLPAYGV